MALTVLLRLISSHEVSFCERLVALRMVGLVGGQDPACGVYALGALGRSRSIIMDALQS